MDNIIDVLSINEGDVIYFNDYYINSQMLHRRYSYKTTILHKVIDGECLVGFFIKRWLVTKKMWTYEYFDIYKIEYRCTLKKAVSDERSI